MSSAPSPSLQMMAASRHTELGRIMRNQLNMTPLKNLTSAWHALTDEERAGFCATFSDGRTDGRSLSYAYPASKAEKSS